MYLERGVIKNYGPVCEFSYLFKFNENQNPKPTVVVGKNGCGKTLLLSSMVHSIIEIKRTLGLELNEVDENKFYRVGSKSYIKTNENYYYLNYNYSENVVYSDVAVRNYDQFKANEFNQAQFQNVQVEEQRLQKEGFFQHVSNVDKTVFENNVFLYFPVDRFYQPAWINGDNKKLKFNANLQKWVGRSETDIIKVNVISEIEQWLLDVIMDKYLYEQTINNVENPNMISGTRLIQQVVNYSGKNTNIQNQINLILTEIYKYKYENIQFARIGVSQKQYRKISILIRDNTGTETEVTPTFSHLSSGEVMILSIFASILKEYDRVSNHVDVSTENIRGIVIIDEIDLHLHSDLAKNVLPILINMFKGIQFIISSHSPFFLLGMKDTFSDNCEFVNLPSGEILGDVENFEEIRNCYNLIDNGFERLRNNLETVSEDLKSIKKPLIITEGKTDWKHFKRALSEFQSQAKFVDLDIAFSEYEAMDMCDNKLETLLKNLAKVDHPNKIIGIFDSDEATGKKYDKEEPIEFGNNVYGWCIPKPSFRNEMLGICVEFLYSDTDLTKKDTVGRRIFLTKEFNDKGSHKTEKGVRVLNSNSVKSYTEESTCKIKDSEVLDIEDKSLALSKNDFAENILNRIAPFDTMDFSAFENVFTRIQDVISKN